jgi:hypothetical protein
VFVLDFIAEIDAISENFLYRPVAGEKGVYLAKHEKVREYQKDLREVFSQAPGLDFLPPADIVCGIVTHYLFGIHPDRYWQRDLTNMIKATEDALFSKDQEKSKAVLPFDDSKVIGNVQFKVFSDVFFIWVKVALLTSPEECERDVAKGLIDAGRANPFAAISGDGEDLSYGGL